MSDSLRHHGLYSPWNSPGQNTRVVSFSLLQGKLPNPGIKPRSPALQADSLPTEPPGKKIKQLQQMVFITNILKSKKENKWLGAEQVHFCMWFPQSTNNIHCTFLTQLIVFCQLKYLRQISSADQHNTLQHYVWKTCQ